MGPPFCHDRHVQVFLISTTLGTRSFGLRHLPADYVDRSSDVEEVKRLLLSGQSSVGVVGTRGKDVVGIKGMGGIGKTVLAQAVCWELQKTRQVIWINVGQTPELLSLLNMLATAISGTHMSFSDKVKAQDWIQENTAHKESLVVLDDVWDTDHASAFDVLSGNCQLLITTRNSDVVRGLRGSELHKLGGLNKKQARELLARSAQKDLSSLSQEIQLIAEQILDECGGLPLAIALIGSSLVDTPTNCVQDWQDRLQGLKDADLDEIRSCFPKDSYPYEHLMAAIDVSFTALPEPYRSWCLDLAVFPEDTEIPPHALEMMWNDVSGDLSEKERRKLQRKVQDALSFLEKRSVLQSGATPRSYLIHDILLDYLQGKIAQERGDYALEDAHKLLLLKYKSRCPGGSWSSGPKGDTYFFQHLAHHLCAAGRTDELVQELSNFEWLQTKLEETDLAFLLSDFNYIKDRDEELELIRSALVLSSNVILKSKQQLGPQVLGRLHGTTDVDRVAHLMKQIRQCDSARGPSLAPLNSCITPPEGPLIRTTDSRSRTVVAIVVTPDRKKIITGASNGSIKVWDFDSGKELNTLHGHTKLAYALALSPNGAILVSGSFDSTIKIWDMETMEEKKTLRGHGDCVDGVLITPDSRHIVSCSNDFTVRVWELGRGTLMHTLTGHNGHVRGIAMTSDGVHVISGSQDGTVKLWNLETLTLEKSFLGHSGTVYTVCFSPDGRYALSGSEDNVVKIWDVSSGREIRSLIGHTSEIYCVTMTPDGTKVLSSSDDMTVRIWWFHNGEEFCTLRGHSESVRTVMVTREGDVAISGSEDCTYKLWNLKCTQTTPPFAGHQRSINDVAVSSDGLLCVTGSDDHLLKVWDCRHVVEVGTLAGHTDAVQTVTLHPDGALAASGGLDCEVKVWDLNSMQEVSSLKGHDYPVQVLKFSQDGALLVSASKDNTIALWDWKGGSNVSWIKAPVCDINDVALVGDSIFACNAYNTACSIPKAEDIVQDAVTFTGPDSRPYPALVVPDGSHILSGSTQLGSHLRSWEVKTSFEVGTACGHSEKSLITALTVSSDMEHVITCSNEGTITKVHLESGEVLNNHAYPLQAGVHITDVVLVPPDENNFVTGDSLGEVKLWSATKGLIKSLRSCGSGIAVMRPLPGDVVAAVDQRGKLQLINLKDNPQVTVIEAHSGPINALAVDEEGKLIATGSDDKGLKIWKFSSTNGTPSCDLVLSVDNAHPHKVTSLAFLRRFESLISGSLDNILIQWDSRTGEKIREFRSSSFGVNCIRAVKDTIIVCFYDSTATVWSLVEGNILQRVVGHRGQYHVSKVSPDGNQAFSDAAQYTLKRWSLEARAQTLATFRGHTDEVTALCLAPDKRHLITGSRDKTVKVWRVESGELISEFYFEQAVRAVELSASGEMAAVGLCNGQLCLLTVKY